MTRLLAALALTAAVLVVAIAYATRQPRDVFGDAPVGGLT